MLDPAGNSNCLALEGTDCFHVSQVGLISFCSLDGLPQQFTADVNILLCVSGKSAIQWLPMIRHKYTFVKVCLKRCFDNILPGDCTNENR